MKVSSCIQIEVVADDYMTEVTKRTNDFLRTINEEDVIKIEYDYGGPWKYMARIQYRKKKDD